MEKKSNFGMLAVLIGVLLIVIGVVLKIPGAALTTYESLDGEKVDNDYYNYGEKYVVIDEYVGGDAYNYIIGATIVAGDRTGKMAAKSIFMVGGAICICIGIFAMSSNENAPVNANVIHQNNMNRNAVQQPYMNYTQPQKTISPISGIAPTNQVRNFEEKQKEEEQQIARISNDMTWNELLAIYESVSDKKSVVYNVVKQMGGSATINEICSKFGDGVGIMEIGAYLNTFVNEGKMKKDEDTKKYNIV